MSEKNQDYFYSNEQLEFFFKDELITPEKEKNTTRSNSTQNGA